MSFEPAIRVSNLGKHYQIYQKPQDRLKQFLWRGRRKYFHEFWALRDVSFQVMPGEVVGIVGRNGSGKSTLLQLVCGTLTPSQGEVSVKGRVAALLELGAGFNPEFTGRENVYMSAAIMGLTQEEIAARFAEIVDFSGIRNFIDQPVKTYSSGMYVRLAFSVAISVDPDILVIDEALSVGDGEFSRKSFDRIMDLKGRGTTILFCSHALYQVEVFCDRVLWLDHGHCVMDAPPQEVIPRYSASLLHSTPTVPTTPAPPEAALQPVPDAAPAPKGQARFTAIQVTMDGVTGSRLKGRGGESDLLIRMEFACDPDLPIPTVGVTLDYGSLLAVTCVSSRTDRALISLDSDGHGVVEVTFPKLALRKGKYLIGVYLGCENALHCYDVTTGVAEIEIEDASPEPGLVTLHHCWRCIDSAAEKHSAVAMPDGVLVKVHGHYLMEVDSLDSLGLASNDGIFEADEVALCRLLINKGDRVLDIGANIGYYTLLFCDLVSPNGVVVAIEPDPANFALLERNLSSQVSDGQAKLHQVALGSSTGNARLFLADESSGLHRLYASVCCGTNSTEVSVIPGDTLELAPLDFIKIDIEGFEPEALKGLAKTIARSPNLKILCEYSPLSLLEAGYSPAEFLNGMKESGFHLVAFANDHWKECDFEDLLHEIQKLPTADFHSLINELKQNRLPLDTIYRRSADFLKDQGYSRPLLENLLFVASSAWGDTSERLALDSCADIPANAANPVAGPGLPQKTSVSPYQSLTFPLNVYAHALLLQEGQAEYLHYGLFNQDRSDLRSAQEYSTELLLSQLPPPPCKILEVGSGLGTTLSLLTKKGYDIHGITPDPSQVDHIQHRFGSSVSISCEPLESFSSASNGYDVILFQESSQYIDLLTIFNKSLDLLAPSGSLVILDELALCRVESGIEGLHLRADILALADRFGFELICDTDLSQMAAPTLDYILNATTVHRQQLIDDLAIEAECLLRLDESNRAYQEKYAKGRYGYGLLHFRKKSLPKWRLRLIETSHLTNFFELFQRSFHHEMSPALWNWKYGDGRGTGIGVWKDDGSLIAHYGGTARDILLFGHPEKAIQVGDVMLAAGAHLSLTRRNPIFLAAATFLEREIGYGKPHLLGFGFPSEKGFGVPERLGLYTAVGRVQCVTWSTHRSRPSVLFKVRSIDVNNASCHSLIDTCWKSMSANMGNYVVGLRDASYIQQRYGQHPEKAYLMFSVSRRFTNQPLGLIVLRKTEDGTCELLDVVGALANIPYLIDQSRRVAATMGCNTLFAWLADNILPVFNLPPDASILDLNVVIPTNHWTAAPDNESIKGKWWLTGGDTDFH